MHLYTSRPARLSTKRVEMRLKLAAGDKVTWRNPATGVDYPGLEVLHVHRSTGAALLKGWFGNYVRGKQHIQQQNAPIDQLTKEGV